MSELATRRIIHIDMDAFYAAVEQRDNADLGGQPVVVAKRNRRAVVTAASYEAREYGIRSAMPAMRAAALCPHAVFVAPDFARYKAVSRDIHAIFARFTSMVEPLSLDEAHLDVTSAITADDTATALARRIRRAIAEETRLAASAGIAPNKFIAKIASDWRKPNGQYTVPPEAVEDFLAPLSVDKISGVGPTMTAKLSAMGITTIADLRGFEAATLAERFGRWGNRLHELAHGRDDRPVEPHRPPAQISSETTLTDDATLEQLTADIERLAERVWQRYELKKPGTAHTVTLKLKTADFKNITRAYTPTSAPDSPSTLASIGCALRSRIPEPAGTRYRLVGIGLSGFSNETAPPIQASLF